MSTLRMPDSRWEPGAIVGDYRIERRLARGGMAELFVASLVEGPAQSVVIKRVHAHLRSDPGFDAMFVRETRIAASLHHPNIVRVLETGRVGDELYLVMELLEGLDGRALLRGLVAEDNVLSYGDAIQIVMDGAKGLAYAHDRVGPGGEELGIVHRDVSPSNLFITKEGEVKLVDFGIAKTSNATQITGVGVRKGKGAYMAPEQCMAGVVDRRTDVFALGAVLYELTTMTRAYDGDNELAVLHAITSRDVERPSIRVPDYPPALEAIVMAALQRDPEKRWQDAEALAEALRELSGRREFQGSTATLAGLVGRLLAKDGAEKPAAPSAVDLTPPPFGVSDRSDGALLLPTPTNMEEIAEADSEQISADVVLDLLTKPADSSGAYRIVSPKAGHTQVAPPAKPASIQRPPSEPAAPRAVPAADATAVSLAPHKPAAAPLPAPAEIATPVPAATVASRGASTNGRIAAVAVFVLLSAGALWWFTSGSGPVPDDTAPSATAASSPEGEGTNLPSVAAAAATSAADADAALRRLNDAATAGAMQFKERHGLIRQITVAGKADDLNLPLHLYLDVAQARQSETPCATFRGAWGSLTTHGDKAFIARARLSGAVPTEPGATEEPDACDGLDGLLSEGVVAAQPAPEPAPRVSSVRRSRKTNTRREARKAAVEPPQSRPLPTVDEPPAERRPRKPKPKVGGKLEDEIRPFGE